MNAERKMTNIEELYRKSIPQLTKKFEYSNPLEVPRLKKIIVNMGVGEAKEDKKALEAAINDLTAITGQKPAVTRARKSVAGFKIRDGLPIGCKVTLRRKRMYEFFDRLVNVAIPRIKDFRGLNPRSFDGRGNYSFGVEEQVIFPEVDYDRIEKLIGMDITIVTTAKTDEEARELVMLLGMPLRRE